MNKRMQAWIIIVVSVLFLLLLVTAKLIFQPKPVCDPSIKSKTVIVIDHSEEVSTQTINAIVERTWKFIEKNVPDGERVSVFMLSKISSKDLKASFSECKPRKEGNRSIEDVKRIRRDFELKFKQPLEKELSIKIANDDQSPIAQGLIDLTLDDKYFRSEDVTRLLVFSDFMENTPKFSLYKCTNQSLAVSAFRASRLGAQERPKLTNVDTYMNIIPRHSITPSALQCRAYFWNWFFGDFNGSCKKDVCLNPDYLPG